MRIDNYFSFMKHYVQLLQSETDFVRLEAGEIWQSQQIEFLNQLIQAEKIKQMEPILRAKVKIFSEVKIWKILLINENQSSILTADYERLSAV